MRGIAVAGALVVLGLLACSSDPSGKPTASADADASSGGSHAMAPGAQDGGAHESDARIATGQGGRSGSPASDAAVTIGRDADATDDDAAAARPDAQTDAGTPRYRLCAFTDMCGMRQGDDCAALPPSGACSVRDSCYYCSRSATNADLEVICASGHWSDATPMACRP